MIIKLMIVEEGLKANLYLMTCKQILRHARTGITSFATKSNQTNIKSRRYSFSMCQDMKKMVGLAI